MQHITKIRRLTGSASDAFDHDVKREYGSGKSIRAIAAESGSSYGSVHRALQRAGVRFRQRGGNYVQSLAGEAQ